VAKFGAATRTTIGEERVMTCHVGRRRSDDVARSTSFFKLQVDSEAYSVQYSYCTTNGTLQLCDDRKRASITYCGIVSISEK
jgi:hypothetical protein